MLVSAVIGRAFFIALVIILAGLIGAGFFLRQGDLGAVT